MAARRTGEAVPTLKKARAIRPGATVGIAAPAGVVDPDRLDAGEEMLRRLGFEPMRRADLVERKVRRSEAA